MTKRITKQGSGPRTALAKEARYRLAMKRRGFRLLSVWVPDMKSAKVRAEIRRQSRLVARAESADDRALLDAALKDLDGWTA